MDTRRLGAIVLLAGVLVLVTAGIASAQTLQNGSGTTVSCTELVIWHLSGNAKRLIMQSSTGSTIPLFEERYFMLN